MTLKQAYCQRAGCADGEYLRRVFKGTLYGHARPIAPFIRFFRPNYFALDYELLDTAGGARTWKELSDAIEAYSFSNKLRGNMLRRKLRVRVSCHKLGRLARNLMGRPGSHRDE